MRHLRYAALRARYAAPGIILTTAAALAATGATLALGSALGWS